MTVFVYYFRFIWTLDRMFLFVSCFCIPQMSTSSRVLISHVNCHWRYWGFHTNIMNILKNLNHLFLQDNTSLSKIEGFFVKNASFLFFLLKKFLRKWQEILATDWLLNTVKWLWERNKGKTEPSQLKSVHDQYQMWLKSSQKISQKYYNITKMFCYSIVLFTALHWKQDQKP